MNGRVVAKALLNRATSVLEQQETTASKFECLTESEKGQLATQLNRLVQRLTATLTLEKCMPMVET